MEKEVKLVYPKYEKSIVNLMASLLNYYNVESAYQRIPELDMALMENYKHIVLIIFDGLGSKAIQHHLDKNTYLRKYKKSDIQSVYPPTTTAAMTSYYTGLSPAEHGWLGWSMYFKECSAMVDVFTNQDSKTGKPVSEIRIANLLLPYQTVYEKIHEQHKNDIKIHTIKPSEIVFPKNPNIHHGVDSLEDVGEVIINLTKKDERSFTAAYWPNPDMLMHEFGPYSKEVKMNILELESFIKKLSGEVEDTLIVVSADHGQTDIQTEIKMQENEELAHMLSMPPSIEGRCASFFVKNQYMDKFKKLFEKQYGDVFKLFSHQEIKELNLFGLGEYHHRFDDFIGDYVACATEHSIIHYKTINGKEPHHFLGHHAGLTEEEMLIPLIIIPCRSANES